MSANRVQTSDEYLPSKSHESDTQRVTRKLDRSTDTSANYDPPFSERQQNGVSERYDGYEDVVLGYANKKSWSVDKLLTESIQTGRYQCKCAFYSRMESRLDI